MNWPDSTTRAIAASIAGLIRRYWAPRSTIGVALFWSIRTL